jgi:hypothetical protein
VERFRSAGPVPALVGIVNRKQQMRRRLMMIARRRARPARIQEERELACELTLSCLHPHERLGYGRTILKLGLNQCMARTAFTWRLSA